MSRIDRENAWTLEADTASRIRLNNSRNRRGEMASRSRIMDRVESVNFSPGNIVVVDPHRPKID